MIRNRWKMVLAAGIAAGLLAAQPVSAAGSQVMRNEWQNENLGPGVARWVDENGNVWDQPGVRPAEDGGEETAGAGADGAAPADSAGSAQETGSGDAGQAAGDGSQESGDAGQVAGDGSQAAGDESEAAGDDAQAAGRVIDPAKPMVALTFDDGPYAPVGNRILDCLAQYNGRATFYVVGERVPGNAAEMQRIVAEGHEIGNHP